MSPILKDYLYKQIVLITTEGDSYIAKLEGFDKSTNLIVSDIYRRFGPRDEVVSKISMFRGSEIVCCGLYEPAAEDEKEKGLQSMDHKDLHINDTRNIVTDEHLIWMKVSESKTHQITKKRKMTK